MIRSRPLSRSPQAGFTMLELIMAMAIFTFLGTVVVVLMRQGMTIFAMGTREGVLQDRMDVVLPHVARSLEQLALPASFDPPPPPPTEEEMLGGAKPVEPPPVVVRLRATRIKLRDVGAGPLQGLPCTYVAFVTDVSGQRSDPYFRRAGDEALPGLVPLTQEATQEGDSKQHYQPTGGLKEVCYVAVPEDEGHPALLTLYYGWRSPPGGTDSLLDPGNLDTLAEIRKRCRPIAHGLLQFDAVWRRVFATDWEPTGGKVDETDPYVGVVWDSTRALDRAFPLYVGPQSLGDPSDDVFPAWVKVEVTLIGPGATGLGRGDTRLLTSMGVESRTASLEDTQSLLGPGPDERYFKVDGEWMATRPSDVNWRTGQVTVERAQRGTVAAPHEAGADVYVGLASEREIRLIYRDRYARGGGR